MPWNKKRSYNLLKSNKNKTSGVGTYTKKDNTQNLTPSSSSSSANSTTGLISKLPKQQNTKKLHKILYKIFFFFLKKITKMFLKERIGTSLIF